MRKGIISIILNISVLPLLCTIAFMGNFGISPIHCKSPSGQVLYVFFVCIYQIFIEQLFMCKCL